MVSDVLFDPLGNWTRKDNVQKWVSPAIEDGIIDKVWWLVVCLVGFPGEDNVVLLKELNKTWDFLRGTV